jgi:NAD+ synthase
VRALGKERVVGVLMPCSIQPDIDDSIRVARSLGIRYVKINIGDSFSSLCEEGEDNFLVIGADARINLQPRLRMAALYMVAQSLQEGGRVINTCNRSEDYVGYATKFGDCAGDMSVLGHYLVSEILAIGDTMPEIPNDLVHKAPSDGLCGSTDEDRFGFTYDALERYLKEGTSGDREVDAKIEKMHRTSRHKYEPMYFCGGPSGGLQ